jgi:hypothetical protein
VPRATHTPCGILSPLGTFGRSTEPNFAFVVFAVQRARWRRERVEVYNAPAHSTVRPYVGYPLVSVGSNPAVGQ